MNKITLILITIITIFGLNAQGLSYENFKWEKEPKLHTLNEKDAALPELILKKHIANEFAFEGEGLYSFYFVHIITRVNSDDAISSNNKVYIPSGSNLEVLETKARVINSKGDIIELDKDDIKEAEDEENKQSYKFFAFEGVDIGSEVEYYYLLKRSANMSGAKNTLQKDIKSKNVLFEVMAPKHLFFEFKSYNGFPEMKKDTIEEDKNIWRAEAEEIEKLKDERMSAYESNLQSVIYKLQSNIYTGKTNLFSYSTVSKNYYNNVLKETSKKTQKKIAALIKDANIKDAKTDEEKIRKLEQYIKTTISFQSFSLNDLSDLEFVLENNIASKLGLMRLYAACFKTLDIPFQLVLTTDRYENKFDQEFESYSFLDEQMFYLPEQDKYLAPLMIFSRFGYIPPSFTHNYGLFIKPVSLGDFISAVGKIKFIDALPHELNSDTMDINIKFEEISDPIISYTKSQMGIDVMSVQPVYDLIEGEDEEEFDEAIAKFINADIDVEDIKIENKGGENFGIKPLITSAKLSNGSPFVEKAGNKYLFKIGELIGPQMEMYQEKGEERKLDVELTYNHSYYRTITFNIPEGYEIKNLDDLNFDVKLEYEGEVSSFFISNYKIEGNKVIMYNEEVYDAMFYPKSYFEQYQKVINAAADFNKVTLVLEKI